MSLILDALSRAEREKREQANPAPSILAQEPALPERESGRRAMAMAILLAAVVMALLAALLFYVVREERSRPLPSDTVDFPSKRPGEQPQQQVLAHNRPVASDGQTVPGQEGARPESSPEASSDSITPPQAEASVGTQPSAEAVAALYAMPEEALAADTLQGIEAAPVETVAATDKLLATESVAEELVDIEQVLREMRAKAKGDTLQPHPAPLLKDLSKQFRDRVPTLMYSRHDFNSAGRSSVVINGETLRPTQRSRGVEVREILADSVILRFEGTDFRMKSLNSWVNL